MIDYRRGFQDVYFTNYSIFNQVSVGYNALYFDRLSIDARGVLRFDDYDGAVDRTDNRVTFGLNSLTAFIN